MDILARRIGIIREWHTCTPYKRTVLQATQLPPIAIAERCAGSVSGGLCSPASAVGQAPTDAARNRLGSMSPSCAGDSMPGSFYFAVSSRRPFHAFHCRKAEAREHAALGHVHSARWLSFAPRSRSSRVLPRAIAER